MSRLRSQTLSGLPFRTKMAWVLTSRQLTIEPAADWPSVMKTIEPGPLSFFLFLAKLLGVFDFGDDLFRDLLMTVKKVQQLFADAVDQFRTDFGIAQLI